MNSPTISVFHCCSVDDMNLHTTMNYLTEEVAMKHEGQDGGKGERFNHHCCDLSISKQGQEVTYHNEFLSEEELLLSKDEA